MGVSRYISSRAAASFLTFITTIFLFYIILRVVPILVYGGNPFEPYQLQDPVLQALRRNSDDPRFSSWINYTAAAFSLDRPVLPDQFLKYLTNIFTFDYGYSIYSNRRVADEILSRLPYTLSVYVFGVVSPIIVGYYLGLLSSRHRGSWLDRFITVMSIISYILPAWILAILIYYFLAYLPKVLWGVSIFPLPTRTPSVGELSLEGIRYWVWYISPLWISILIAAFGSWAYFFRQLIVSEAERDYVITARAKGLSESTVLRREVIPALRPPIIQRLAYTIPGIFGGALILEIISSWPGIAYFSYQALTNFDYPVIIAFFTISTLILLVSLFIADLVIALVDPRVRVGGEAR